MRFKRLAGVMLAAVLAIPAIALMPKEEVKADNPVVQTSFTADPSPIVVGDTMYLITSHDEDILEKNKPTDNYIFFTMKNWKCYSTKDMVNWTDHGTIFGQDSFTWGHTWCYRAWAGQCVERDGKFYLYVPLLRKGANEQADAPGYGIGVAVADNPYGPYEDAIGKPLIEGDWYDIDPTVYIDDDGQAYLFYGQTLKYCLLNDDMISLKTQPTRFSVPNYVEGPWFTKHDGTYYFMWAANGGGTTSAHKGGENLQYAYCDEPLGSYTYGGILQETTKGVVNDDGSISGSFTNHIGVTDFQGKSYMFYHTNELPGGCGEGSGAHRSVCVTEINYRDDKKIDKAGMPDSVDPIGTLNPYERVEAETICWEEGVKTEMAGEWGCNDLYVYNMHDEDYIKVREVDFGDEGAVSFKAAIKDAKGDAAASIDIVIEDEIVGTLDATNESSEWEELSVALNKKITGVHDVKFVFHGNYEKPSNETGKSNDKNAFVHPDDTGMFKFDYWSFEGEKAPEPTPVVTTQPVQPTPAPVINKDVKVSKITVNKKKVTLKVKKSFKIKVTVKPANATNKKVTYKSSNKKVAKVSSKGIIKALKKGKAVITITAKDGSKKVAKITVKVK